MYSEGLAESSCGPLEFRREIMKLLVRLVVLSLLLVATTGVASAAPVTRAEFEEWRGRFVADYRAAAKADRADESVGTSWTAAKAFSMSLWAEGIADNALDELYAKHTLFPPDRTKYVTPAGVLLATAIQNSDFAGEGGSLPGEKLHKKLAKQSVEIVYTKAWDDGDRVDEFLRNSFKQGELKAPASGKLQRDVYPFLVFHRVDGKLYLAAFSREFLEIINAITTMQIAMHSRPGTRVPIMPSARAS